MSLGGLRIWILLLLLGAWACGSAPAETPSRLDNVQLRAMAARQQLPPCPPRQSGNAPGGILQAPSGRLPLGGVPISLLSPLGGAPVASTTTDACGRFQFAGAPPGPYLVRYGGRNFSGTMLFNAGGSILGGLPFPFGQGGAKSAVPVLTPPVPQLRAAVVPGAFDDIVSVLDKMGIPYTLYGQEALAQPLIYQHPMIFVACDGFGNPYAQQAAPFLRNFVMMGGSLYATHNAIPYVGAAFAQSIGYDVDNQGGVEVRRANVIDPGLAVALGGLMQVDLVYDTGGWGLLNPNQPFATLPFLLDTDTQKPTAVRFMYGLGSVRFSSFHKEPQMSATQEAIIIYIISGM